MDKKYQVFVSSTYEDLQEERQHVLQSLLEMNTIPAGMEFFPAADESQWELIKTVILESDYYILIVGGRYGSIGPHGISYTEMEYDFAVENNIPTLIFLHGNVETLPQNKCEKQYQDKFEIFVSKLKKSRLCKFWNNADDLGGLVCKSIAFAIRTKPAVGWIRANSIDEKFAIQLLQLKEQNENLKIEKAEILQKFNKPEKLAFGEDELEIKFNFYVCYYEKKQYSASKREKQAGKVIASWNNIFIAICPCLINEVPFSKVKTAINQYVASVYREIKSEAMVSKTYLIKYENFMCENSVFDIIKIQMRALELIETTGERQVNEQKQATDSFWKLTPYGDRVMTAILTKKSS